MSKCTNRPMSEYESALNTGLRVAFAALIRLGADKAAMIAELQESIMGHRLDGSSNAAATVEMMIQFMPDPGGRQAQAPEG